MRAHQRERKLAGQQFVIGEPRPGRRFRQRCRPARPGRCTLRSASAKEREALAREPGRRPAIPADRAGASSAASTALRTWLRREPFGQRIDRLDQRQLGEIGLVDHAVGMHHLPHAVVERDRAGDVAPLADRQQLFEIVRARVEEGEDDVAGVVAGIDLIGRARAVGRRRPVAVDGDRDRDDACRAPRRAVSAARGGRSRRSAGGTGDRRCAARPRGRAAGETASRPSVRRPEGWSARRTAGLSRGGRIANSYTSDSGRRPFRPSAQSPRSANDPDNPRMPRYISRARPVRVFGVGIPPRNR